MVLALHPELKMPTVMPYGVVPDPIQEQVRKLMKMFSKIETFGGDEVEITGHQNIHFSTKIKIFDQKLSYSIFEAVNF